MPVKPQVAVTHAARTALAAFGMAACASDALSPNAPGAAAPSLSRAEQSARTGAVYTLSNAAAGNQVIAFRRAADGALSPLGTFPTGGAGTGGAVDPLASQYSVILSDDHRRLYAVDAGSNGVASFRVGDDGALALADHAPSGGTRPVSLALSGHLLYVLNSGDNVVHGYRAAASGHLAPLPGATRALAAGAAGASTIEFSGDRRTLIVTERVSSRIETFPVEPNGRLGAPVVTEAPGRSPFGFDVVGNHVLVSESTGAGTDGAAASYLAGAGATLSLVTAPVDVGGLGACWLIATPDGRYAYTVNSASATLTALSVGGDGQLAFVSPPGPVASTGTGTAPLDPAFSSDGAFFYVLKAGVGTIGAFHVNGDHGLTPAADTRVGAPASGLQGLAAF